MKVYVDMDGVIADFFTELADHYGVTHWKNLPDKDASVKALKGTDFFGRLPKFDTSDELIDYVDHLTAGDWSILSSPLRDDHDNSGFWKRHWLEKNDYHPQEAIFAGYKAKYAVYKDGSPNILIDDRPKNIDAWVAKGGIGIRYQALESSLDDLKDALSEAYLGINTTDLEVVI